MGGAKAEPLPPKVAKPVVAPVAPPKAPGESEEVFGQPGPPVTLGPGPRPPMPAAPLVPKVPAVTPAVPAAPTKAPGA
eukprot:g6611.t1